LLLSIANVGPTLAPALNPVGKTSFEHAHDERPRHRQAEGPFRPESSLTKREHKAPDVYVRSVSYFRSLSTAANMDGSNNQEVTHDSFLGFKLPARLKSEAKREAEKREITVSELVRRRLKDLDTTAGPATT